MTVIVSISVTIAMYCLVQLYLCVAPRLAPHQPILKLFSIKAVVFLTFWQASFLSLLATFNAIKDTPYMTAEDIEVGWGAILETAEMCAFALLHIKAFSYTPYVVKLDDDGTRVHTPRLKSLAHAFNFGETMREIRDGWVYMLARLRGRETDTAVRRLGHHEKLFARSRPDVGKSYLEKPYEKGFPDDSKDGGYAYDSRGRALEVGVHRTVEVDRDGEKLPSDYASNDGYGYQHHRSWWRGLYDRISSSHFDDEPFDPPNDYDVAGDYLTPGREQRDAYRATRNFSRPMRDRHAYGAVPEERVRRELGVRGSRSVREYDDAPPPSLIRGYRAQQQLLHTLPGPSSPPRPRERISCKQKPSLPRVMVPEPPPIVTSPPTASTPSDWHNLTRPSIPHLDSTSTGLGFGGAFRSLPPSSSGHVGMSTPSLVSSGHRGEEVQPMIRQVHAGRVVNVALPAPLAAREEGLASPPRSPPSYDINVGKPPLQSPSVVSPFQRRSQARLSFRGPSQPVHTHVQAPPRARQSLDVPSQYPSAPSPFRRQSGQWVHPELANDRPVYAAAMQPPSQARTLVPPSSSARDSFASAASGQDDRSFVTASEGDGPSSR